MQKDIKKDNIGIIIDDTRLDVEKCNEIYRNNENNIIYCLGVSKITPKEMEKRIIENDTEDDWSSYIPKTLRSMLCENTISESKENRKKCMRLKNIKYVDTSEDREDVLNQIINDLENILI